MFEKIKNVSELTKNELNYIISIIPYNHVKKYFNKNPREFQKLITGMRAQKLSEEMITKILVNNINKPFINEFVNAIIQHKIYEMDENIEQLQSEGESLEEAFVHTLMDCVFCYNVDVFYKLVNNDNIPMGCSEAKERMEKESFLRVENQAKQNELLSSLKINCEKLTNQNNFLTIKNKKLEKDLKERSEKYLKIKSEFQKLQEELDDLFDKNKTLNKLLNDEQAKTTELSDKLQKYEILKKYNDACSNFKSQKNYEHTSICVVKSYHDKISLKRVADIDDLGNIKQFIKDPYMAPFFENRDYLIRKEGISGGPSQVGKIGVWNWNAIPNNNNQEKDYIETSFNPNCELTRVRILYQCKTLYEIPQYLKNNMQLLDTKEKTLFVTKPENGIMQGLLCHINDFEYNGTAVKLKSDIFILPVYNITESDYIVIEGAFYLNKLSLGIPDKLFKIKSPVNVVKQLILKRATKANLQSAGMTKEEIKCCQNFIKNIDSKTLNQEIADKYDCTFEEAEQYVNEFIEQADKNLSVEDIDLHTLSLALENNKEFSEKCKQVLSDEWNKENEEKISVEKAKLDEITKQIKTLNEEFSKTLTELKEKQEELNLQKKLGEDVEKQVKDKIEKARADAADFIAEMAFTMPVRASESPADKKTSGSVFEINKHINCTKQDEIIEDSYTFEECLEKNLRLSGYNSSYSESLSRLLTYCLIYNTPFVVNYNADKIAECIGAIYGIDKVNSVTVPLGETSFEKIHQYIMEKQNDSKCVILLNGIFDGMSFNLFNEYLQCLPLYNNAIVIPSVGEVDIEIIPNNICKKAFYIDGDLGINNTCSNELNAYSVSNEIEIENSYSDISDSKKIMKKFSGIIGNITMIKLAQYLSFSNNSVDNEILIQLQLAASAKIDGLTDKLNEVLSKNNIQFYKEINDKYL